MPRHVTLAGQLLALQLLIVLGVLVAVVTRSRSPSPARTTPAGESPARAERRREPRRATRRSVSACRSRTREHDDALPATAESVADAVRRPVRAAGQARRHGGHLRRPHPGRRPVPARPTPGAGPGAVWTGPVDDRCPHRRVGPGAGLRPRRRAASSVSPSSAAEYPSVLEPARHDVVPNLLAYLGVASAARASVGSLLLARRVKRQTLGMEPHRDRRAGRAPRGAGARRQGGRGRARPGASG